MRRYWPESFCSTHTNRNICITHFNTKQTKSHLPIYITSAGTVSASYIWSVLHFSFFPPTVLCSGNIQNISQPWQQLRAPAMQRSSATHFCWHGLASVSLTTGGVELERNRGISQGSPGGCQTPADTMVPNSMHSPPAVAKRVILKLAGASIQTSCIRPDSQSSSVGSGLLRSANL